MKRLIVMAVCSAIAGWLLGDMLRASGAERQYAEEILASKDIPVTPKAKPRHVGNRTTVIAPRDEEDQQADDANLPDDIRNARLLGAKARTPRAAGARLQRQARPHRQGQWLGHGRSVLPARRGSPARASARAPVRMAAVPGSFGTYSYMPGSPFSVAEPLGYAYLFGPGDPSVTPHAPADRRVHHPADRARALELGAPHPRVRGPRLAAFL